MTRRTKRGMQMLVNAITTEYGQLFKVVTCLKDREVRTQETILEQSNTVSTDSDLVTTRKLNAFAQEV